MGLNCSPLGQVCRLPNAGLVTGTEGVTLLSLCIGPNSDLMHL